MRWSQQWWRPGVKKGQRNGAPKPAPIQGQNPRRARVERRTILDGPHRWAIVFVLVTAAFAVWSWLYPL